MPTITVQPTNQAAVQGEVATFSVTATGTGTLRYQWFENGAFMLNAAASTLDVFATLLKNGNEYTVTVEDDLGSVDSDPATLTVQAASQIPPVLQGPDPVTVIEGAQAEFRVTAYGVGPFTYQWRVVAGAAVPGGSDRVLTFPAYLRDNGAYYQVTATDVSGLQTVSEPALLTVLSAAAPVDETLADIDWPCAVPGPLVDGNSYTPKDRVTPQELSSGPPLFWKTDDGGWQLHNLSFSWSAGQLQAFKDWYRHLSESGSKLFNMPLWVDGPEEKGGRNTRPHQCYIEGVPQYRQQGRRWRVNITMIAIEEELLSQCANLAELFDATCGEIRPVIEGLAQIWPPVPPELPEPPPGPPRPECQPYECDALQQFLTAQGIGGQAYNLTSAFALSGGNEQEVQDALRGVPVDTGNFDLFQSTYAGNSFRDPSPLPAPGDQCVPPALQFPMQVGQSAVIPDPWRLAPTAEFGGIYNLNMAILIVRRPEGDAWYLPTTNQFSFYQYAQRAYGVTADPTASVSNTFNSFIFYSAGSPGDPLTFTARAAGDPEQNFQNQTGNFIDIPMGSMNMPLAALDDWCVLSLTVRINPFIAPKYEIAPGNWWQTIGFDQEFIASLAYNTPSGVVSQSLPPVNQRTYGTGTFQLSVPDGTENTRRYVEVGLVDNPGQFPLVFWGADGLAAHLATHTDHIDAGGLLLAHLRNNSGYTPPPSCP